MIEVYITHDIVNTFFFNKLKVNVQLQILVKADADNECNESNATAKIVNSCPKQQESGMRQLKRKAVETIHTLVLHSNTTV